MSMRVAFHKVDGGRLCAWRAQIHKHQPFQGTTMASGRTLPHDLAQFVVESLLGLPQGFWSLLADGATFESVHRRRTKPGRRVISTHRAALVATERIVNAHVAAWRAHAPTPVGPALDAMLTRWRELPVGEELSVEWPALRPPVSARRHGGRGAT